MESAPAAAPARAEAGCPAVPPPIEYGLDVPHGAGDSGERMSATESSGREIAARLRKLAMKRRYDDLEAAWADAVEGGAVEPADLLPALERVARAGDAELTDSLLWFLLTEGAEQRGAGAMLPVARAAAELVPESAVLREELASLYRAAHPGRLEIDALVELTVEDADRPLPDAVARLEALRALRPGTFVLDPDRGAPARVAGFDADARAFELAFADATRSCPASDAHRLERLDSDDFRALSVFDPTRLRDLAEQDPGEFVTRTLRAFGPRLTFKSLQARVQQVLPDVSWRTWWSAARPLLNRAPWVDVGAGARPTFALRKQPIAYADIQKAVFNAAASPEEQLGVVLGYLKETAREGADPGVLAFFGAQLARLAGAWRDADPAWALGALAVTDELHRRDPENVAAPEGALEPLLPAGGGPADLMRPIRDDDLARLVLGFIRRGLPDRWRAVYAAVMPGCTPAGAGVIAGALSADELRPVLATVLAKPDRHAGALAWLWRILAAGGSPEALAEVDRAAVALALVSAAASLGRGKARAKAGQERWLGYVRAAVSVRNYEPMRAALEGADEARARQVRTFVERHTGLSELACDRVREILHRTHPALFAERAAPWEEDVIYTTAGGLEQRRAELSHLVNVKIAEASCAIGAAAERGDLSENAEYAAAKEERGRLAARATRMQDELSKAKLIAPAATQGETVTVGSAVDVRDVAAAQESTFVFLGPWDADPDRQVYSYQTKLGLAFMGKRVGDQVIFAADGDEHTWEITGIRPAV